MISPMDTHIAFFGGAASPAAIDAIVKLKQAGYDVVCASHDPRESVALREAGIAFIADRVEALSDCQVVITSLRTPADVEELYMGDDGLLELADAGTYLIDVSFSTPQLAREINAMAAVSEMEAMDAPIVCLGEKEEAVVFVGGDKETRDVLSPLFPYLASTVYPQNDAGEGQFAAMISYIALAGSLMGAIEALSLAHIAGFPPKAAISALASTAGGSRALIDYIPRMLAHDYSGNISVSDFLDALEVALDAADDLDVTVPMIETAYQLYDLLSVVGGNDLNIQSIALLYEDEKTCADYGLDWTLADTMENGREGGLGDINMEDFFHQNLGGSGDDDDDSTPGAQSPGGMGYNPFGGAPGSGGLFSKN